MEELGGFRSLGYSQAAVTVARRVAEEMQTEVGEAVGYAVRFEERKSSKTRILYLTGAWPWHHNTANVLLGFCPQLVFGFKAGDGEQGTGTLH